MSTFYLLLGLILMAQKQIKLKEFIAGINEVVQLLRASDSDLYKNEPIDKDVIFKKKNFVGY